MGTQAKDAWAIPSSLKTVGCFQAKCLFYLFGAGTVMCWEISSASSVKHVSVKSYRLRCDLRRGGGKNSGAGQEPNPAPGRARSPAEAHISMNYLRSREKKQLCVFVPVGAIAFPGDNVYFANGQHPESTPTSSTTHCAFYSPAHSTAGCCG